MLVQANNTIDPTELERRYGAPFVPREQKALDRATGGAISAKTLANLDSLGRGPSGRVRIGRRICYPSADFFAWLVGRMQAPQAKGGA